MVLAMEETILGGGDFLCDLDNQRADTAGAQLRAVPAIPAATTFIGVTTHFDETVVAGIEADVVELVCRGFAALARAALRAGADYAIVAKRDRALWRARQEIGEESWRAARDMDAEVAECDYLSGRWPPASRCVVRRVRVDRDELRVTLGNTYRLPFRLPFG